MSIIGNMLSGVPTDAAHSNAEQWDIVMVPFDKIVPSPNNFYGLRGIDGLAQSIEENGLKQCLTVHRIPDSGLYEIESGGRRYEALKLLLSRGNKKYELVPCKIEPDSDEIMSEVRLIEGNARTRQLTDYEKVIQAQRLKELYAERKKRGEKIPGRTRDNMAKDLDVSSSQFSIYESISNNLIPDAMAEFKVGKIDITAAYEASKLPAEKQAELVDDIRQGVKVDVKAIKKKRDKPVSSPEPAPIAPPTPPAPPAPPEHIPYGKTEDDEAPEESGYKICAQCGHIIENGQSWYKCLDNFLQIKYFDEQDESDNVFCSETCFCKSLFLTEMDYG